MNTKVLFSSHSPHYGTPREIYADLDAEFHFNDDPCPLYEHPQREGLEREWGTSTFINPPYGRQLGKWMRKAYAESKRGKVIVCLIPSRTDTAWWHDYVMKSDDIRFIRGRLRFNGAKAAAPFPSAIVVFRGRHD